jgi:hypothetical protein
MTKYFYLALAVAGGMAQAFPIWEAPTHDTSANNGALQCTDFSGEYTGSCTIEGKRVDDAFKIEQADCDVIRCHGKEFAIGSLISMSIAKPAIGQNPAFAMGKTAVINWSQDKKDLLISGGFLNQSLNPVAKQEKFVAVNGSMSLNNNKLVVSLKREGGAAYGDCEFTKK